MSAIKLLLLRRVYKTIEKELAAEAWQKPSVTHTSLHTHTHTHTNTYTNYIHTLRYSPSRTILVWTMDLGLLSDIQKK